MKKIFYFSGTHWDREWYQTFQGFRMNLERTFIELIEFLEKDDNFKTFYFDGQTIILEDFLEVRPEYYDRLKKLIENGRIKIGGWYCMPDEFLVSGESLIRNLKLGHDMCKMFETKAWKVGYICDVFGHIAQFPQILSGFNIQTAVLGRGTNQNTTDMFFDWVSPDGTKCLVYKLPDNCGYGSFAMEVIGQKRRNKELDANSSEFKDKCKEYIDREFARSKNGVIAIFDAMDHESVHKKTQEYISEICELYPDCEVIHGDFDNIFKSFNTDNLQIKYGELIETAPGNSAYLHLITNILSSRYDIKSRNDKCQSLLEKTVEPFGVYFSGEVMPVSKAYENIAWKHLLQNHPHDSMCGCGIDRVHKEMEYRFSQVESISEAFVEETFIQRLSKKQIVDNENCVLNIFNMLPRKVSQYVTIKIPFNRNYVHYSEPFGYEDIKCFRLYDEDGIQLPYRIERIEDNVKYRTLSEQAEKVSLYTVVVQLTLKPFGATRIFVKLDQKPVRFAGKTADYSGNLENKFLQVKLQDNGKITITNKKNGKVYKDLCGYNIDSEIGDGYFSVRSKCGVSYVKSNLLSVEILSNNENGATVKLLTAINMRKNLVMTENGIANSGESICLNIETELTLNANEDFVRVKTTVNNNARDFRLRLILPTDTNSNEYSAFQTFCFIDRFVGYNKDTLQYKEFAGCERNFSGISKRVDGNGDGLCFLSKYGLHEVACDDDSRSSMIITLMRCFSKTITTKGEEDGQLQGLSVFEYLLKPITKSDTKTDIKFLQDTITAENIMVVSDTKTIFGAGGIEVKDKILISALKRLDDENGTLLRLYNVENDSQEVEILLDGRYSHASIANSLEESLHDIPIKSNKVALTIQSNKIVSVKLV